jgi:hypothetical protein
MTLMTNISKHIGTAAERAAMSTTGLAAGSLFEETDTGFTYTYDGTTWALSAAPIQGINITDPADITRQAKFDNLFKVPIAITVSHHEIHEGDSFTCNAIDLTLASAATMSLAFKTPSGTKRAHVIHRFITLTGGHVEIIEGPTWTNQTGTKQPIYNRKREASMGSSGMLEDQAQAGFVASDNMILEPGSISGGTVIHTSYAFGRKNQFTGASRETDEILLKPATQYVYKFTSDAADNSAHMILDWYEHQDE